MGRGWPEGVSWARLRAIWESSRCFSSSVRAAEPALPWRACSFHHFIVTGPSSRSGLPFTPGQIDVETMSKMTISIPACVAKCSQWEKLS